VHKAFYAVVELQSILNKDTVSLGRRYYISVLKEYRPHLVLSVHDCLNRGTSNWRARYSGTTT